MSDLLAQFEADLAALAEQRLDDDGVQRIADAMADNDALCRVYVQYMELHATLQFDLQWQREPLQVTTSDEPIAFVSRRRLMGAVLALAAMIVLAIGAWQMIWIDGASSGRGGAIASSGVAIVTHAQDAVLTDDSSPTLGGALRPGTLDLRSGSMQMMFKRGAVIDLSGPCAFGMTDDNSGYLTRGRLSAFVPPSAHGFTVHLPNDVRIIDLGTRFTVIVDDHGAAELFVTEGQVQLASQSQARMIMAGQTCRIDAAGKLAETTRLANLVNNPGFEEGDDSPNAWHVNVADGATYGYITSGRPGVDVHSGHRAVYVQGPGSDNDRWFTTNANLIPARVGQTFHFEVWIKTEHLDSDDKVQLRIAEMDDQRQGTRSQTHVIAQGDTDWTLASLDLTIESPATTQFRLLFVFNHGDNESAHDQGRATFDDALVIRLPDADATGARHE